MEVLDADLEQIKNRFTVYHHRKRFGCGAKEATTATIATTPERTTTETMWTHRRTIARVGGGSLLMIELKIERYFFFAC